MLSPSPLPCFFIRSTVNTSYISSSFTWLSSLNTSMLTVAGVCRRTCIARSCVASRRSSPQTWRDTIDLIQIWRFNKKQESIQVGWIPPAKNRTCFSFRGHHQMSLPGAPHMNKFEQASSDHHQMSIAGGGGGPQVWCLIINNVVDPDSFNIYYSWTIP